MAIKYERILFCTDFSEDADYAFLTALDMAEKYQARLFVLHVLHSPYKDMPRLVNKPGKGVEEALLSSDIIEKGTQRLRARYEPKMSVLRNNCQFHLVSGIPIVEIVRFAHAKNVDLIVLGAAGSSNVSRIPFGSTAENVARRAHCSVMVVRYPGKTFQ
jgi:Universal stress protein UspA and related nucleotide-binding proteins